jgi:AcrR family transcriptional regulator
MIDEISKPARGRPKTFDREKVLKVAMMRFWTDGPTVVTVNDICAQAGVSKPSLYREFGNEDGLKKAALEAYHDTVLTQISDRLRPDQPFAKGVDALVKYVMADRATLGLPLGCLLADMCQSGDQLGALTKDKAGVYRQEVLSNIENWVNAVKASGELRPDLPAKTAALYIDSQTGAAMMLQKQGVQNGVVEACLRMALSALA